MPAAVDRRPAAQVLHISDCHLGASTSTHSREEAAFEQAIDVGRDLGVDVLLVTGDLFDHARVPEDLLEWTTEQLDRLGGPVVVLPGNHDHVLLERFDLAASCRAVQVVRSHDGEIIDVPGTPISVWGRAMPSHEPAFRPLHGVPPRPHDRWGIVAGHGLVLHAGDEHRSSPIRPDDLQSIDWDYVALGHVHEHQEIDGSVPTRYAGATAASRAGVAGGVLVEFDPLVGAVPRWISLAP